MQVVQNIPMVGWALKKSSKHRSCLFRILVLYLLFFFFMTYLVVAKLCPRGYKPLLLIIGALLFIGYPFFPDVWILIKFSKFFIFFALGTYLLEFFTAEEKRTIRGLALGLVRAHLFC
ncbi:Uncharacterised protein [Weissella viridescens]|uniref:Uncharacterized protein n=1 Tax=Weissella viridescens TaxID=1629 RepID=A0A380P3F2_WEIVI|nr:Uncharacterised protein [Weissella viridescens]